MALPLQAGAQEVVTLVSNAEHQTVTGDPLGNGSNFTYLAAAQEFITGGDTLGYRLSSVKVSFFADFSSTTDEPRVSIYDATSSGEPNRSLYVLDNPAVIRSNSFNTFAAPVGATLNPNTQYFVVVEATKGEFIVRTTSSDGEDTSKPGWSIGNNDHVLGTSQTWSTGGTAIQIAIRGSAVGAPIVVNRLPNWTVTELETLYYEVPTNTFFDADGDELTYTATKPDGSPLDHRWLSFAPSIRTLAASPPRGAAEAEPERIKVTASDGTYSASTEFTVWVRPRGGLELSVEMLQTEVTEGEPVRYRINFSKRSGRIVVGLEYGYEGRFMRKSPASKKRGIRPKNDGNDNWYWEGTRRTVDDGRAEADGTFTVRLVDGPKYVVGSPSLASIDIRDNDGTSAMGAAVSVASATVQEGPGAVLAFPVTLDNALPTTATVDYATADGTAKAGSDYEAASGTLTFLPGQTSKTVRIRVIDDAIDEGKEIMLLRLRNPQGVAMDNNAAVALGFIENTDLMPQAWLARFGRTVAEQVLDAVEARMRAGPRTGAEVTLAGQRLGGRTPDAEALAQAEEEARLEDLSTWLLGEACRDGAGAGKDCPAGALGVSRAVTDRDLLTGSAFALTGGSAEGGFATLWGRGAVSRFDGRVGELNLDGEVTSVMLGTDWTRERWSAGLMVSHARGEGGYRGADSGAVDSTLTGLYPWGRYAMTDRVTVWGTAGYGAGTLTLTPEGQEPLETDMDLALAAAGLRGVVVEAPAEGGAELAVKTDALAVRTSSDALADAAAGNLAASTAEVTRLRLGLEGAWRGLVLGTGTLAPRLELGVRHDGGDAETGFGLDLGAGLAWSDPETGFSAEASGRGLLTHEASGFGQRGFAGRLGWDPRPGTDRGPSLTLTQSVGLSASGGADALLGRRTLEGLAANDDGDDLDSRRLEMKLGYGFAVFENRFTATPEAGFAMSGEHREYRLGWRLGLARGAGNVALDLGVEAIRREASNDDGGPEQRLGLGMTARW